MEHGVLVLAAIALGQLSAPPASSPRTNFSEILYWASADAAGVRLCDHKRRTRYKKEFNRRYGDRVQSLMQYHVRKFGPDEGFVVTTSCRHSYTSPLEQDRVHALAMNRFELTLRDLERRFGPRGGVR